VRCQRYIEQPAIWYRNAVTNEMVRERLGEDDRQPRFSCWTAFPSQRPPRPRVYWPNILDKERPRGGTGVIEFRGAGGRRGSRRLLLERGPQGTTKEDVDPLPPAGSYRQETAPLLGLLQGLRA